MHADLVLPLHDPSAVVLPQLRNVTPILVDCFDRAITCTTAQTRRQQPELIDWFERNKFYHLLHLDEPVDVGEQFRALYAFAVENSSSDTVLHLAFPDRLVFALSNDDHRQQYLTDIEAITEYDLPLLYQRSEYAWSKHPESYRELEGIATRVGELLFGKTLDFGWCYMVIRAGQLGEVIPTSTHSGLSMLAEILLPLRDQITTRDVDWLAWEDPFITGIDRDALAAQRETSKEDHLKRLSYVVPILELLVETARQ